MGISIDYRKEIVSLAKDLPDDKLKELMDFAYFLKVKKEGFSYTGVTNGAEYLRNLRTKEGKRIKSGKSFIEELIEWQKSNF